MEIYALKGYKVKVTDKTRNNGFESDKENVRKHLQKGKVYTIDKTNVSSGFTDVFLQEFPNIEFNSVNFEGVNAQSEKLNKQHKDYNRIKIRFGFTKKN